MAKVVVGSDQKPNPEQLLGMYEQLDGQVKEIKSQFRRGVLTPRQVQALIEHRNPFEKPKAVFQHDKTKDGWILLEDVPFDLPTGGFTLDIVEFLKSGESSVNGDVLRQRAKEVNANLGQRHAEYLLNHQDLIPKDWRGEYYLVFPGTVWQSPDGNRFVPYLRWLGGRWCLGFGWLGYGWGGDGRLVSLRK